MEGYAELVKDVGTYKQLALVAGGALTGGGAVDVYYVPLETTPA